ncbi:cation channel family protein (macronuclear) [Tetrahymena thermophila SB210]|uniref:Cation channel family protein n=1 Tax=Tetrahymena thermophila (strain SB210) TaxID=312017 RepID=I7LT02_TETTS|nr:cation channel family protein [Tetrahymena thermophila SB210]EAR83995.2 cation channel family protein [Tetrahymena thermophila SB210]|eukprot:XP_001031658.2 cation channel family protein [Tetrahymena thermophila SB210]
MDKLPTDEDNNNLAQNMIAQNSMVHNFLNNQSQAKCLGDSSLLYPQSLNNFDKQLYMKQNSKKQNVDLSESQQQFYQYKKASYPNLIFDPRRTSHFQSDIKFHRQSDYLQSSRSINLESIEDFQRFNIDIANKSQYSIKMKAHSIINQSKYQIQSMNQAKQYSSKVETLCSQNKQNQDLYVKNKIQAKQVNSQVNQNDKRKEKKKVIIVSKENKTSRTSIEKQKQQNGQNLLQKFLQIRIKTEENNNSIRFDKGIQIIKRILPNKYNFRFRVEQKVKQFIEQLNLYHSNRNLKSIYSSITKIIGDKSSYYENQLCNSTKSKNQSNFCNSDKIQYQLAGYFYKKFCCIMNKNLNLPLIMPANPYLLVWDSLYLVIINSFLYIYSIYCFFGSQTKDKHLGVFCYVIFFTLAIDRVIQFNTAFYEKDVIIQKRQKIIERNVFSFEFLIDLLVTIVIFFKLLNQDLDSMTYNPANQILTYFINCFVFLLIYRNLEKKKNLSDVITIEQNQKHLYRLFTQLFNVFLIAHISAICMWILYLVEEYYQINNNWVNQANIQNQAFYEQYFYSLYWSITTLTTVGYGDIHIQNYQEAIFISFVMILFSCVFAYSVSNIGVILQEIQKNSRQLQERLSIIQKFMNRKNINSSLKSRVKFYLNFLASEQKNRDKNEEDIVLGLLSNKLRNEIIEEINYKIINKYSLFMVNFQSKVIKEVVYLMEEIIVAPNEIIFKQNDSEDQSIYFIQSGDVEIFVADNLGQTQKVLAQITSDSVFGEISFFSGLPRTASARSLNLSTIYKINRQKFICFLQNYPEDFQRYKMIQESEVQRNKQVCKNLKQKYRYYNSKTQLLYQQNEDDDSDQLSDTSNDDSQTSMQSSSYSIYQRNMTMANPIKRPSQKQNNEINNDKKLKKQISKSLLVQNQNQDFENKKLKRNYSKNQLPELNDQQNIDQQHQNEIYCQSQQMCQINNDCNLGVETNLYKSSKQIIDHDSDIKQSNQKSQNSLSSIYTEQKCKDKHQDDYIHNDIQNCNETNEVAFTKHNQDGKTLKGIHFSEIDAQSTNELEKQIFYQKRLKTKENDILYPNNLGQISSQINLFAQKIQNNYQLNPRKNILLNSLSKTEAFIQLKQIEQFDSMKIFKRFFPHNNFDKVLKKLKQVNNQQIMQSLFASKDYQIQPTYASYGIFVFRSKLPIKFN